MTVDEAREELTRRGFKCNCEDWGQMGPGPYSIEMWGNGQVRIYLCVDQDPYPGSSGWDLMTFLCEMPEAMDVGEEKGSHDGTWLVLDKITSGMDDVMEGYNRRN